MRPKRRIPLPGMRILRTMIAVWICLLIYYLRGKNGVVVFSVVAALQGIQPYTKDMRAVVLRRIIGTLIGAAWGLLLLLVELELLSDGAPHDMLHFSLVALGVGAVIYFTVLLKLTDWTSFSAMTFMSVTITHITDSNPYLFAFHRMLDTLIGVGVAELVNRIQLPRAKDLNTLFVSSVSNSIVGESKQLSPYSRVELNRMIEDGAKFTISTIHTQARVRELLPGVRFSYPIVVMDGAALYDTNTMEYLRIVPMSVQKAKRVIEWLHENGYSFFNVSVEDDLLLFRFTGLGNEGIRKIYETQKRKPYRSFLRDPRDNFENLLYLQVIAPEAEADGALDALRAAPWAGEYRFTRSQTEIPGYGCVKIYDCAVSREAMVKELAEMVGAGKTLTFGGVPGKYDVYIRDADRDLFVKELKKRFEPVDWKNWKSVLRL